MVDITQAFVDLIRSKTVITDLVGARIFNDNPPQGIQLPCLVYWIVTDQAWSDLQGHIGLEKATFQLDAYGVDRAAADLLAWSCWSELDGFVGVQSGVRIHDVSRAESGIRHLFDPVSGGTDQRRFITTQDLEVSFYSFTTVTP